MRRLLTVLLLLVPFAAGAADPDYRALTAAAVNNHILPRYKALAEATTQFESAARGYCAGDRRNMMQIRQAWLTMMVAWEGVQHVRFGPIDLFNRQQRFAFWPDPRNVAGRQMADVLNARDPAVLTPDRLVTGSVAVQGLNAAERILWGDDATKIMGTGDDAQFRCTYLMAIAANLNTIARETSVDWSDPPRNFSQLLISSNGNGLMYVSPQDAAIDIFKSLYTAIELVSDHKLARPLAQDWRSSKPRLAEFWRSNSSAVAIVANLDAARDLYRILSASVTDRGLDTELKRRLDGVTSLGRALGGPLENVVGDKTRRPTAERLRADLVAIKALLAEKLTLNLGIPLGFNALDGD
jgi:predicted lipoprotein